MIPPVLIPWLWRAIALAAVLAALAGLYAWWAGVQQDVGEQRVVGRVAVQAAAEAEVNAKETQRRLERQKENDDAQALALDSLARDLSGLRDAGVRQQARIAALVAAARGAGGDPAAAPGGPGQPGRDALDLLSELYGRADREAAELAEYADRIRIAGERCERDYDALSVTSSP